MIIKINKLAGFGVSLVIPKSGAKTIEAVNANSTTAPRIVDRAVQPILDRAEAYFIGSRPF